MTENIIKHIKNHNIVAIIDSGSDMCLMRAGCYDRLDAPPLIKNKTQFGGMGSHNKTLGGFDADVCIDDDNYSVEIHVILDILMHHDLLIGADFLRTVDVAIKKDRMRISKPKEDLYCRKYFRLIVCMKRMN